jgi:hypothetical protein
MNRLKYLIGLLATSVSLTGCSEATAPVPQGSRQPPPSTAVTHGIIWTAKAEVYDLAPTRLRVRVHGRNAGLTAQTIYFGACNVRIRLFDAATNTQPAWDSAFKWDTYDMPTGCILPLYSRTIAAGDTIGFGYAIEVPDLVADSIEDGRYHVTAQVDFGWDDSAPIEEDSTGEISAGTVELRRAQAPLPSIRVRDGVRYEASSVIDSGVIVTSVAVTNQRTTELRLWRNTVCQFSVYGFGNRSDRDQAFRTKAEPWHFYTPAASCNSVPEYRLAPGETRIFQQSGLPRSWTSPIIPAGTYYLATAFYAGYDSVVLAAGEIQLH